MTVGPILTSPISTSIPKVSSVFLICSEFCLIFPDCGWIADLSNKSIGISILGSFTFGAASFSVFETTASAICRTLLAGAGASFSSSSNSSSESDSTDSSFLNCSRHQPVINDQIFHGRSSSDNGVLNNKIKPTNTIAAKIMVLATVPVNCLSGKVIANPKYPPPTPKEIAGQASSRGINKWNSPTIPTSTHPNPQI